MSFLDYISGRVGTINKLRDLVCGKYRNRIDNVLSSGNKDVSTSPEFSVCLMAVIHTEYMILNSFQPDVDLFMKYSNNISEHYFDEIYKIMVVWFIYHNFKLFPETKNIDEKKFQTFLALIFEILPDKFEYIQNNFINSGNDIDGYFEQICNCISANKNDSMAFIKFSKLAAESHKSALSILTNGV